jgi:hypothetical protein
MPEDAYRIPIIGGTHYTLEGRNNHTYIILNIKIILYYKTDNKTSLILLSILEENALDSLYLLGSRGIHSNNRGHTIGYYICT